jgi:hypothetical protein
MKVFLKNSWKRFKSRMKLLKNDKKSIKNIRFFGFKSRNLFELPAKTLAAIV